MQDFFNKNKILIVGDSGRGKTILAENISRKIAIPVYSIDDVYWKIKFSEAEDSKIVIEKMKEIYSKEKWIVEGSSDRLAEMGFEKADLIIHLYFKNIISQFLVIIKRYLKRRNKHPETAGSMIANLKHNFYKRYKFGYKRHDLHLKERLVPYKEKVVTLKSYQEINAYILE